MKSIIFIAPPAAGKGTQSALVSEKYNIPHISTGDLLRNASKSETELGKLIKETMESGGLVSDEVTLSLLKNRLSQSDCNNGYILDGFPRNTKQAEAYEELLHSLGKDLGTVIVLDLDKETAKSRIVGRLSCSKCGKVYNTSYENMKPKKEGICDDCGISLSKRNDDNADTFENRFDTYMTLTEPLIQYYEEKGVLKHVYSGDDTKTVFSHIEKVLGE